MPRNQNLTLEFLPTKDLVANFAANHPKTYSVAFALVAEDDPDLISIAEKKLWDKGVSAIVANRSSALGAVVTDVTLVTKDFQLQLSGTKSHVGVALIKEIAKKLS